MTCTYGPIEEFAYDLASEICWDVDVEYLDESRMTFSISNDFFNANGIFENGLTVNVSDLETGDELGEKTFLNGASEMDAVIKWVLSLTKISA
jgi:hypothetical protein